MDQVTQQNAALVEEAAAAAASMRDEASQLAETVAVFKLSHHQTTAQASASTPRAKKANSVVGKKRQSNVRLIA